METKKKNFSTKEHECSRRKSGNNRLNFQKKIRESDCLYWQLAIEHCPLFSFGTVRGVNLSAKQWTMLNSQLPIRRLF
jgi:hypothetical protein